MRILEIETFGRGGLTHYAYNLSCALAERGHEVTFLTSTGYELEERGEQPAKLSIEMQTARLTHGSAKSLPGVLRSLAHKVEAVTDGFALARAARRLQPDVIHLHSTNPIALLDLGLLRRLGRPVVETAHVVTPHEPIRFQDAVYGRIHRLADLVIAHSEVDRARLLREFELESSRVTVIPHGEYGFFERNAAAPDRGAARQRLGLEPDEEVALFFGYIREYKGLDVLFEAWPAIVSERPRARLVVVGDPVRLSPARRDELEAWAERLGAIQRFDYVPFAEVAPYFAASDTLVMPYRRISQSGVLFLALSLGVPVVATRVGALPEMLRDGESALLVPPESPADLSAALVRVLGDAELRATLTQGGLAVAAAHSWTSIAERTERAFEGLVEASRSAN